MGGGGKYRYTKETEIPTTDDFLGTDRDLGTGQGRQGGANRRRTWRQNQECGAGRRYEQHRLVGGGWGQSTDG